MSMFQFDPKAENLKCVYSSATIRTYVVVVIEQQQYTYVFTYVQGFEKQEVICLNLVEIAQYLKERM